MVHAFSTHNLLLRYWLASGGADPDRDIETVVIPPEEVVDALAAGSIAGFCAGAPWGDVAERQAGGTDSDRAHRRSGRSIRKSACASGEAWAEANPELLHRLLRAVLRAQVRCDQPEEAPRIAALLADPERAWLAARRPAGRRCPAGRGRS